MQNLREIIKGLNLAAVNVYRREIIGCLIVFFFSIFFYQKIYVPNSAEIAIQKGLEGRMRKEVEGIRREIREIPRLEERLRKLDKNLRRIESRFMILQGRLPSKKQISGILKELTDVGPKSYLRFSSLRPLHIEDKGEYLRLPFQISLDARYRSFGDYLRRIEGMPRVLTVDNVRLDTTKTTAPTLGVQLYVSAYMLDEGSGIPVIQKGEAE